MTNAKRNKLRVCESATLIPPHPTFIFIRCFPPRAKGLKPDSQTRRVATAAPSRQPAPDVPAYVLAAQVATRATGGVLVANPWALPGKRGHVH